VAGTDVDAVVVGVGGIGSAALYHLASRGLQVVGVERFHVPHDWGSSHGESRILRIAYFEDPAYVPLVRRALELWRDLERISGERLFLVTGGLDGGPEEGPLFSGSLASCREHGLDHEVLDGHSLARRFPVFRFPESHRFVLQPEAGILRPERCTETHARMAEALGAELRTATRVVGWEGEGGRARLFLDDGSELRADALVLTPGPWAGTLLPGLAPALRVERQVVGWTRPPDESAFAPERMPVFNVELDGWHHYGFPAFGGRGPKVGRFGHFGEIVDPDVADRGSQPRDRDMLEGFARRYLVGAGPVDSMRVCLFTRTPDRHFVVDLIEREPRVAVGCGFSGHGFKFASVLGEVLAGMIVDGDGGPSIAHLRADRPGLGAWPAVDTEAPSP
jgi:sarcosine oxidase